MVWDAAVLIAAFAAIVGAFVLLCLGYGAMRLWTRLVQRAPSPQVAS